MTEATALTAKRAELLHLANEAFPQAARSGAYPVRFNHCFLRIVYDNLFGQRWQRVLPKGQPAYKQLDGAQLERAIELGQAIIADPELCRDLNQKSLEYRGKR